MQLTLRHDESLTGDLDAQALIARLPDWYLIRGAFMTAMAEPLAPDVWQRVRRDLEAPPRERSYIAIKDYPQRDFVRLWWALAEQRFGHLPARERARRIARQDIDRFLDGTVGRIVMSIAGDLAAFVSRFPEAYKLTVKGQHADALRMDNDTVRVRVYNEPGSWEYTLGQVEGIALHFQKESTIDVTVEGQRLTLDLRLV